MKIDIVIPAYNASATISDTLSSALSQDYLGKVIVVNDGSTDDTSEIVRGFGDSVVYFEGPNRGVSAARNKAISSCEADFIVFLDADDQLLPGTLARRLQQAKTTCAQVIITDWEEFTDDSRGVGNANFTRRAIDWERLGDDAEAAIASHVWATTSAIMYRIDLVRKVGGFRADLPVIQDARFLFDAASSGARFAHSDHIGARYRISERSLSRASASRFWRDILLNGRQIEEIWRDRRTLSADRRAVLMSIYYNAGRGLFSCGDHQYFDAIAAQQALGISIPLHSRMVAPFARAFGLSAARSLIQVWSRP
ncbi:glycosyltransferase family 2 protein [Nostoc sp. NIES-2111]